MGVWSWQVIPAGGKQSRGEGGACPPLLCSARLASVRGEGREEERRSGGSAAAEEEEEEEPVAVAREEAFLPFRCADAGPAPVAGPSPWP